MYDHICVISVSSLVPIRTKFLFSSSRQRVQSGDKTSGSYLDNRMNSGVGNALGAGPYVPSSNYAWRSRAHHRE